MISLPLWVVTEHIHPSDTESVSQPEAGKALAFTSGQALLKFMKANLTGEWKMQMAADRSGLIILIADLHRLSIESLTLNPETNGSGGEQLTLSDLSDLVASLEQSQSNPKEA
jgi:hypothetical protein